MYSHGSRDPLDKMVTRPSFCARGYRVAPALVLAAQSLPLAVGALVVLVIAVGLGRPITTVCRTSAGPRREITPVRGQSPGSKTSKGCIGWRWRSGGWAGASFPIDSSRVQPPGSGSRTA